MKLTTQLTDKDRVELQEALLEAFPTSGALELMLWSRLGKDLDREALGDDTEEIVMRLLRKAMARNWLGKLIEGAHAGNPDNIRLTRFYERFFALPSPGRSLQKILQSTNPLIDFARFTRQMTQRGRCICRIESKGKPYGTGFLVGPDVVLTNHHVIESLSSTPGAQITAVFDYQSGTDGRSVGPGKPYPLAQSWLLASAPASPVDEEAEPKSGLPDPDQLDFALLRVAGSPGKELFPDGERGWISLPEGTPDFTARTPLCLLQHPQERPLQLAIATDAIVGLNDNETRLKYTLNTMDGSSGSPCFNLSWELIALHHSGDPALAPTYNEGIPIHTLRKYLIDKGFGPLIGVAG